MSCRDDTLTATHACGRPQHPVADVHDQTGFLRHGQKVTGRSELAVGLPPADQRFDEFDVEALQIEFGLKHQLEIAFFQRPAQALFHCEFRRSRFE